MSPSSWIWIRTALPLVVAAGAAATATAQGPVVSAPVATYPARPLAAPVYRDPVASRNTYRVFAATPRYAYPAAPTYVAPGGYRLYGSTPFQRYRSAIDRGMDPNWGTRRGMRLYKPWLY